jgi:DNA helicase HerA-like ATPase
MSPTSGDSREDIERAVPTVATSMDGRDFTCQAGLHGLIVQIGDYVVLEAPSGPRLGQLLHLELVSADVSDVVTASSGPDGRSSGTLRIRVARGSGVLLERGGPFQDVPTRPASSDDVRGWLQANAPTAALDIGELMLAAGVPARLDARGFDRHTFLCGQSGSGKTYSLGLVLERLLLETSLRIVILDLNSDYVRLGEVRPGADEVTAARYGQVAAAVDVRRAASAGGRPLRVRFGELGRRCQAAMLHLDPVADREEYAALSRLLEGDEQGKPLVSGMGEFLSSDQPGARELGLRATNLGLFGWEIWEAGAGGSIVQALADPSWRALVVDVGSLGTREEQSTICEAVLGTLWEQRRLREPVLVVIDEAHNVCPQRPEGGLQALATEHAVQIAAEGRKFGLYLLVSTQRPQKVHENVLSQCDNLMLMRMNSAADLQYLGATFSFVPPGLLSRASRFGLGEALVSGKMSPEPTLVRFGARISQEGGADVPTGWATRP